MFPSPLSPCSILIALDRYHSLKKPRQCPTVSNDRLGNVPDSNSNRDRRNVRTTRIRIMDLPPILHRRGQSVHSKRLSRRVEFSLFLESCARFGLTIAFQTGEALQVLTGGKLAATPHYVSGNMPNGSEQISRETFAFFLQYVSPFDSFPNNLKTPLSAFSCP